MNSWIKMWFASVRRQLEERTKVQSALTNTGWLFFDRVLRLGAGLLISVWVARYLGPSQFGILNYALSFTAIVASFVSLGFDSIVVRELVNEPGRAGEILGTAAALRGISGIVAFVVCGALATIDRSTGTLGKAVIVVVAAQYLFSMFDTLDNFFQSRVRSKYPVIARNTAFLISSAVKIICLLLGASLMTFAVLVTVESVLAALGLLIVFFRRGENFHWSFRSARAMMLLRDGLPLALAGIAIMIYMKIDQVMLGNMVDTHVVGLYAAAVKMVEVWYFVPMAITTSIFPYIVEARKTDPPLYKRRLQQLYDVMSLMSITLAIIITATSPLIIKALYGVQYAEAAPVLTIYIWSGVATFLGVASSQFLTAENLTRISLWRTVVGGIVNVGLNFLLIPSYGMIGSAVATLISYIIATFGIAMFRAGREQGVMMLKSLFFLRGLALLTGITNDR